MFFEAHTTYISCIDHATDLSYLSYINGIPDISYISYIGYKSHLNYIIHMSYVFTYFMNYLKSFAII